MTTSFFSFFHCLYTCSRLVYRQVSNAALVRGRHLLEGGAYSSLKVKGMAFQGLLQGGAYLRPGLFRSLHFVEIKSAFSLYLQNGLKLFN